MRDRSWIGATAGSVLRHYTLRIVCLPARPHHGTGSIMRNGLVGSEGRLPGTGSSRAERARRWSATGLGIALLLMALLTASTEARVSNITRQDEPTQDLPDFHEVTDRNGGVRFLGIQYPNLKDDPFHTTAMFYREAGEKGPPAFEVRPGTLVGQHGNLMVVVKTALVELGMAYESQATVEVELCHLGMEPWQRYMNGSGFSDVKVSRALIEKVCALDGFGAKSLDVRQAVVWMTVAHDAGELRAGASALFEEYRRTCMGESVRLNGYNPFGIDAGDWAEAYAFARGVFEESAGTDGKRVQERGVVVAREDAATGDERDGRESSAEPAPGGARAESAALPLPIETVALGEVRKAREVTFEATFSDLENTPYAVEWTAKRLKRSKVATRFESAAGSIFDSYGQAFVCLDAFEFELGAEKGATASGTARVYARLMPRDPLSTSHKLVPANEDVDLVLYLASLPEMQRADDSVRQAAMFHKGGGAVNFASYKYFYDTKSTSSSGEIVTRLDPYDISKRDWAAGERITDIVTPERREALDAVAMEQRSIAAEKERVKREERERVAAAKQAEAERIADREARTIELNLQTAIRRGLISVSLDEVRATPEEVELRVTPATKLGDAILELRIPAGTIVREVGGRGRTAYLELREAVIEGAEPVVVSVGCLLHDLGDAGPGEFAVEEVDALAASMQDSDWPQAFGIMLMGDPLRARINSPLAQMMFLIHGTPGRTAAEWREVFRAAGNPDPYTAAAGAGAEELARDAEKVHATAALFSILAARRATDIAKRNGRTYSVEDLVGSWRPVAKSRVMPTLAELEGRKAEEARFRRPGEELPDARDVRAEIDSFFESAVQASKENWFGMLNADYRPTREPTVQQDHPFELTLSDDHTFEVNYDSWSSRGWRMKRATGTWTWDGDTLLLNDAYPRLDYVQGFVKMHKGTLVVVRDGIPSYGTARTSYPLLLEKR